MANVLIKVVQRLIPTNFIISVGTPIVQLSQISIVYTNQNGTTNANNLSENFYLTKTVSASNLSTPGTLESGLETRYWLRNRSTQVAPIFAHLQTQEMILDLTGSIASTSVTGSEDNTSEDSIALPTVTITSTVYGSQ
jgi:hypothetical protein